MKKTFLFVLMLCASTMNSQINVNTSATPNQMAQAMFGSGATVSNAVFTGWLGSAGTFTNGVTTNLGINAGIVLTSGDANAINSTAQWFTGSCYSSAAFPPNPLSSINGGQPTFDVCKLEFDVVPYCTTFSMKFVFGSEEYPEWVGQYNDAFGIFVSGPNPAGGNYANLDIAVLPSTIIPVTVPTVNPSTNAAYYIDNQNSTSIVYDGLTVPIVASVNVVSCSTYHVIIMISDGGDCNFDSGVFLTPVATTCPPPVVDISPSTDICLGGSTILTANGADHYFWSPAAGLNTTSGPAVVASPTVTTTYTVFGFMGCDTADGISNSVTVNVLYPPVVSAFASNTPVTFPEQTTLSATGATSYVWQPNGDTTESCIVIPDITTTYTVTGTSGSAIAHCSSTTTVTVEVLGPIYVPNAFSPNNDGDNDIFIPKTILTEENFESYEFLIFDRWGKQIFETKDINVGWNGIVKNDAIAQEDVYVWTVKYQIRGNVATTRIGTVSLIK